MNKVIIIDNLYESFYNQPDNGILIANWYSDMEDKELGILEAFLGNIVERRVEDVRDELRQAINSEESQLAPKKWSIDTVPQI